MSKIYSLNAIRSAAEAAPPLTVLGDQYDRSKDSFADGSAIKQVPPEEEPHALLVASPEDLRDLLKSITQSTLPLEASNRKSGREIEDTVGHEEAHAQAANAVGAAAIKYGVRFFTLATPNNQGGDNRLIYEAFTSHKFNTGTSSLMLASILAYPLKPSHGDLVDMRGLGFHDVEDIAEQVLKANKEYNLNLPVPQSYSLSHDSGRTTAAPLAAYVREPGYNGRGNIN